MTTTMQTDLYNRYRFFKRHDVGRKPYGQHAICALLLAKAELWAQEHGVTFLWEHDDYADLRDHERWCKEAARFKAGYGHYPDSQCNHEILWCRAVWHGETQGFLWWIIDPDTAYRRVVEAELALEAQGTAAQLIYH